MSDHLLPLQRIKRTDNEGHWEWSMDCRRTLFEDTVYSILDCFTKEKGGGYKLDESFALHGDGWRAFTTVCIWDYWQLSQNVVMITKPKNAAYLREVLIEYLDWGLAGFKGRSPEKQVVPAMPDFDEFLASRKKSKKDKIPVKINRKSRPPK
jgi:hypothetical protein